MNIFALIPFFILAFFLLLLPLGGVYIGFRYLKGNVFKKNEKLGKVLIITGLAFFVYSIIEYILSNLTGNYGGELRPIFTFLLCTIIVPLGLVLRN